jgi:hypothetical protein
MNEPQYYVDSKTGKTKERKPIVASASIYTHVFDAHNRHWSGHPQDNKMFLKAQEQWCNDRLNAVGHVFLNEVYDMLGFDRTSAGAVVGWLKGDGIFVDFGMVEVEGDFTLNFNVQGVIYDKIGGPIAEQQNEPYSISRELLAQMVAAHTSGMFNAIPEQADFDNADAMISLLETRLSE